MTQGTVFLLIGTIMLIISIQLNSWVAGVLAGLMFNAGYTKLSIKKNIWIINKRRK